jgi:hypothetical protein
MEANQTQDDKQNVSSENIPIVEKKVKVKLPEQSNAI